MTSRQQLGQSDLSSVPRPDALDRPIDLFLPAMRLGHQSGNGAAMAGNDDRLTTLHVIEELGEAGLGLGSLDFAR